MRIRHIYVDGFGMLHNLFINDMPGGLVLFLGDNEAGKSTCLAFLRDMFFGFKDGRSSENIYPALAGGQHGGRLTLMSDRFKDVVLERRPGKKGGNVIFTFSDGRKGGEEHLRQLLGSTTRELFRNIYAFSLTELQTLETLKAETIKSVLYGAAMGTATLALPTALKSIDGRLGELFKSAGRNQEINKKLAIVEDVRGRLREARREIEHYDELFLLLRSKEKEISGLQVAVTQTRKARDRAEALIRLWDDWLTLIDLEHAFDNLPLHVDTFPEKGLQRIDAILEQIKRDEQLISDLGTEREEDMREIDGLLLDESILAQSHVVQELLSRKEVYLRDCQSLFLSQEQMRSRKTGIEVLLSELGGEWSEDRVRTVDRSLFTREEILRYQQDLEELDAGRQTLADLAASKKSDYETACRGEEDAEKELKKQPDPLIECDDNTLLALQKGRDQFASVIRDLPQVSRQSGEEKECILSGIREINTDWEERHIREFDCSIGARQRVQQFEDLIEKGETESIHLRAEMESIEKERKAAMAAAEAKVREREQLLDQSPHTKEDLERRKSSLRLLRALIAQKEKIDAHVRFEEVRLSDKQEQRAEHSVQTENSERNMLKYWAFISAGVGVVSCLILLTLKRPGWGAVALVLSGIAAAAFLRFHRQSAEEFITRTDRAAVRLAAIDKQIIELAEALSSIKASHIEVCKRIKEATDSLSFHEDLKPEEIDVIERRAETDMMVLQKLALLQEQQEEWRARAAMAQERLLALNDRNREAEAALQTTHEKWEIYLCHAGLPAAGITPRTVDLIFVKIENLKAQFTKVRDLEERLRKMEETRREYLAMAGRIPSLADASQKDPNDFISSVDTFLNVSREWEIKRNEREMATKLLEERTKRRRIIEEAFSEAQQRLEQAEKRVADAGETWRTWLSERGFNEQISPSTAIEALEKVGQCVRLLNEKSDLKEKTERLERDIRTFEEQVRFLFPTLEKPIPSKERLPEEINRLGEEYDGAKTNLAHKKEVEKKIAGIGLKIKNLETKVAASRMELKGLLDAGGTSDEETFRVRGSLFEEKRQLALDIEMRKTNMKKITGDNDIASLRKELEGLTLEGMRITEEEHRNSLKELEERLEVLRQERAELNQTISRLASSDDILQLRGEEEVLAEEIRILAKDWGRHAFARTLLAEARRRFEQEQQPKVINDAGGFFREITGERYRKIYAPIGEDVIEVLTEQGQMRRPEELSRGTAEQLYLAIRFGYIANYSANGETLPVIMDDVLVNFDPTRAAQATKAIFSLAGSQQVLYFTCHPETIELFRVHDNTVTVYELKNGQIAAG